MSIKQRVAKIEARKVERGFRPAMSFIWDSPADDAALEAITQQADAEGRLLIVTQFVDPPQRDGET